MYVCRFASIVLTRSKYHIDFTQLNLISLWVLTEQHKNVYVLIVWSILLERFLHTALRASDSKRCFGKSPCPQLCCPRAAVVRQATVGTCESICYVLLLFLYYVFPIYNPDLYTRLYVINICMYINQYIYIHTYMQANYKHIFCNYTLNSFEIPKPEIITALSVWSKGGNRGRAL